MENLPPMICDLCIVQLNVAYNFKRQATESDTKLRQYLIENGIDIMKDVRSLPAIRTADQPSASIRTLSVPNRTDHRVNSGSSASVFEVSTNRIGATTTGRPFEPRLIPIRIKVETPETVEQSSEPGDLLSTSTISPLSAGTVPVVTVPSTSAVTNKTNSSEDIVIESSPASSKGSLSSNGRDSAMVVVNSQNISLQGDEDYVQTILGSSSSLSTNVSKSVEKHDASTEKSIKKTNAEPHKDKHSSPDHEDSPQEKRLKNLLSSLRINMVTNARFPQSKLRIKPRKKLQKLQKLQKLKQKQQTLHKPSNPTPKPNKTPTQPEPKKIARRHSVDLAQLLNGTRIRKEQTPKKNSDKGSPGKKSHVISPGKLRSLRDMLREERVRQKGTGSSSKKQMESATKPAGGQKVHDDRTKTTVS